MKNLISASAPARIDFTGGTLDLLPLLSLFKNNIVINMAISLRAKIEIQPLDTGIMVVDKSGNNIFTAGKPEDLMTQKETVLFGTVLGDLNINNGIKISYSTGSPFGAGLGGSSVLLIALLEALLKYLDKSREPSELVNLAGRIEEKVIKGPIGKQDYISAVSGGLNTIRFTGENEFEIEPLKDAFEKLQGKIKVYFTGKSHFSGNTNFKVVEECLSGNKKTISAMRELEKNSAYMFNALKNDNTNEILESLIDEMTLRKKLLPSITTPQIDKIEQRVKEMGGAMKVCGAGGGGSVFTFFKDGTPDNLDMEINKLEAELLDCEPEKDGLKIFS